MNSWKAVAGAMLSALGLALIGRASSSVDSTPVTADLTPAEPGSYAAGAKWQGMEDGEEVTTTLVSINGKSKSFEESRGCKCTEDENMFAPGRG